MARYGRGALALAMLLCAVAVDLTAAGDGPDSEQKPAATEPAAKPPARPLFPRHHRGIYNDLDNREVVDATPQSPPLETDDPGVPDKGTYEINLTMGGEFSREADRVDLFHADANYGFVLNIGTRGVPAQAKVEFPVTAARAQDEPFTLGVGPVGLGLKFNFYNSDDIGLSMSIYPQLELHSAEGDSDPAASGVRLIVPFLVAKEFGFCTAVANVGVNSPLHTTGQPAFDFFGVGLGRAVTRKLAAMAEVRAETALDLEGVREVILNGGVIYGVRHIIMYTSVGRSVVSDDGVGHTQIAVGIKLFVQPSGGSRAESVRAPAGGAMRP